MEHKTGKNSYELNNCPGRKTQGLLIISVMPDSAAEETGVEPGDVLLSVNGSPVSDELDWIYLSAADDLVIEIKKENGEIWDIDPELDEGEDFGAVFEQSLGSKTCSNNCMFCFIDQMPSGMRDTLYIKDDDERLSFLNGNYITLTNLRQNEIDRIKRWKIPVNISIHSTDPETRVRLLGNRFAGKILDQLKELAAAGVQMNGQIVCVPGINDGEVLRSTLEDLGSLYPQLSSVSVVPVGITRYREGLADLTLFNKATAGEAIDLIEEFQQKMLEAYDTRFVFPSDEFFLTAERRIPKPGYYEGFPQLENGVGMLADFVEGAERVAREYDTVTVFPEKQLILTGVLAGNLLKAACTMLAQWRTGPVPQVLVLKNRFFGETVTVSGLFAGKDVLEQAKEQIRQERPDRILIPDTMLKNDTEMFLDDMTVTQISEELGLPVTVVRADGEHFVRAVLDSQRDTDNSGTQTEL
ncbi:MAG: DUF512 domain-containing protein [Eubacteriaceae bacterium]|jgi:putative radical SAM enzyme (TIGR03279 family)